MGRMVLWEKEEKEKCSTKEERGTEADKVN